MPDSVTERTHLIFSAFEGDGRPLTFSELSRRTGLPKTTVHRLVTQLADLRWLERTEEGFTLSNRIFRLLLAVPARVELREAALPFMQDLYEATHETVHLAVRDDLSALYVEKIVGRRQVTSLTRVGGHMPLHCTGVGKVLLAHADAETAQRVLRQRLERMTTATITQPALLNAELRKIREGGHAYDRQESSVGMTCVAAAITNADGHVVGALSVAGGAQRFRPDTVRSAVVAAALGVGRQLRTLAAAKSL
ncbi:Transcriptional regulator, IclR family [Nocardioides sp. PD653-B2]|nr:Transcriptional regulator, IclR family [Nocardioides sp. PD653-B2]